MGTYFATLFENDRYAQSLVFLLSITDPDISKQSKLFEFESNMLKNLALRKKCIQRALEECVFLFILD